MSLIVSQFSLPTASLTDIPRIYFRRHYLDTSFDAVNSSIGDQEIILTQYAIGDGIFDLIDQRIKGTERLIYLFYYL